MKNLDKEYKDMIDSEVPDLWGKISAQLGDNSKGASIPERIQSYLTEEEKQAPEQSRAHDQQQSQQQKPAKVVRFSIYRYGGLVAAGICIALLIPVLTSMRRDAEKSAEVSQSSVVSEALVETADDSASNEITSGEDISENFANEVAEDMESSEILYDSAVMSNEAKMTAAQEVDAEVIGSEVMEADVMEAETAGVNTATVPNAVTVSVEIKDIKEIEATQDTVCYTAEIMKDCPEFNLKKGETIQIWTDEATPSEYWNQLERGQYDLKLSEISESEATKLGTTADNNYRICEM